MDILELEQYNLQDAVELHDELNPKLFDGEQLRPEVRNALLRIADDFAESLGIKDLDIEDVTFSGSNAAYAYTPHSDIDLHLIVAIPEDGDVYKELFNAKKYQYNDSHDITVRGYDVELYVQPADDEHISAGIYSLKNDDWIKIPVRRKIKINDRNVRSKYETLKAQIESAVASNNHNKIAKLQQKIKKMRQSGLEKSGEFGAENLAFKMLRSQGLIKKLLDARQAAKSRDLSIDEANRDKPTFVNGFDDDKVSEGASGLVFLKPGQLRGSYTDVELEALGFKRSQNGSWYIDRKKYDGLVARGQLRESASGYIPSNAEKNDPRYSNALTVDVGPDAIKKNAKKLGFNTSRAGIPPKLRSDGKLKESKTLTESAVTYQSVAPALQQGIQRAIPEIIRSLGLKAEDIPPVTFTSDRSWARDHNTFGVTQWMRSPKDSKVYVFVGDRYLADILRTYTHELQHVKQFLDGVAHHDMDKAEHDHVEADANTVAGRVIHDYGKRNDKIFTDVNESAEQLDEWSTTDKRIVKYLTKRGYRKLGAGVDQTAFLEPGGKSVLKIFGTQCDARDGQPRLSADQRMFLDLAEYCEYNSDNPYLPKILGHRKFIHKTKTAEGEKLCLYLQIRTELLQPIRDRAMARLLTEMASYTESMGWTAFVREMQDPDYQNDNTRTFARLADNPASLARLEALYNTMQDLLFIATDNNYIFDLHEHNIMQRSDGTPVLNDPWVFPQKSNPSSSETLEFESKMAELAESYAEFSGVKLDEKCWSGYRKQGMKKKGDRMVPNCVKVSEAPSHEISKIVKTPVLQAGDRVWIEDFQKHGKIKELSQDRARVWIDGREHIFPVSKLRKVSAVVREDEELNEVKMSPSEFKKFLNSPAAEGIRAGFEAELIFRDTQGDPDSDDFESEEDYDQNEDAGEIDDIINFFTSGDDPLNSREAQQLQRQLEEQFKEWAQEQFDSEYFDQARFQEWCDDNIWPKEDEEYREQARTDLGDDATDEEIEKEAVTLFRDDVEHDWDRSGKWYDQAREELWDEYWGDLDQSDWLYSAGLHSMRDVAYEYSLHWPYWTENYRDNGGTRDWEDIATSLGRATGYSVRTSSGYHNARRGDWYIIEPDGSLDPDNDDEMGLEIVSPPMPLPEAVEQLQRVIDWANGPGNAYTKQGRESGSGGTGLHIGVSLPFKGGDVDPVKLILFMGDKNLLELFGRESNTYARSAYDRLESKIRSMKNAGPKQIEGVMELMKNDLIELADRDLRNGVLGDKYVSVHPHDGYIEFRGPGGDYLAKEDEISGVLENTMLRLAYAMSIAGDNAAYRNEYAKKLYKVLTGYKGAEISKSGKDTKFRTKIETENENPFMRLFADYSAGTLTGEELKARWADTVLAAERDDVEDQKSSSVPGEYEVYDRSTGTPGDRDSYKVIDTFPAGSDQEAVEMAMNKWAGKGIDFVVRKKAREEPKSQKPKSRRAELAKRVTRSTRDVGEQLWRVNHHSSVRWVIARSQAEAVNKAVEQDRMFDNPETRARIATDTEKQQWQEDEARRQQRQRDSEQDAAQIRARLGKPQPVWRDLPGGAPGARIVNDPRQAAGEPIPGSTLDIQRRRQQAAQQSQGEFTGYWQILDSEGRRLHLFGGIGNSQADANRYAAGWLGRNRPDLTGQEVDVVPEMI